MSKAWGLSVQLLHFRVNSDCRNLWALWELILWIVKYIWTSRILRKTKNGKTTCYYLGKKCWFLFYTFIKAVLGAREIDKVFKALALHTNVFDLVIYTIWPTEYCPQQPLGRGVEQSPNTPEYGLTPCPATTHVKTHTLKHAFHFKGMSI